MCSCLCLGGLCIPYPALLPMLIIVLQWISKRTGITLPHFITNRGNNNVITSSTKGESEIQQHHFITNRGNDNVETKAQQHGIDEICNDFWCLCKQRFYRKSSGDSTISAAETEISTSFDEDDSSDGGEVVLISEEEKKINNVLHRRRRSKKTKKTPDIQFIGGEWCMPCQESDGDR